MTPSIRLFVPDPLQEGGRVEASPGQAHYLGGVMRRGVGDMLRLFNGADGEFLARIVALKRERAEFAVEGRIRAQAAEPDLWLVFAPLKRDATDMVVQKATELGVAALLPVFTERSNTARVNLDRWRAIATEAAEQCERLTVPLIEAPLKLMERLAGWKEGRRLVAAIEHEQAPPVPPTRGPAALLIGPEGGFAPAEVDALRRHPLVVRATLGARLLRADTAAIVGLALLQAQPTG